MRAPKTLKPATYADLEALPENMVGEIIDGELIASPRLASPHAFAASVLLSILGGPFGRGRGGPGGWWILVEPELHLREDILVPDLAGWRRERMPTVENVPFFTLAPDWVCEIVSPGSASIDRVRKLRIYARSGIEWAWLLDPLEKSLEAYRLQGGHYTLLFAFDAQDAKVLAPPFDAIELELQALWLPPAPTSAT